uniref:Uncharacterized protein n=1 Tax=Cryptomonas curvata TaxID=233186 RepID=A0A7S0QRI1_9CRYP|mmetsp:Transcript_51899/g.108430  ORF Transcript_51899/g.108430 Transcript_51899/m.108430 type:complete len:354 (+) Transcript_51899:46-1107(+)
MEWLQKAGDLLEKLDKTAAETLAGAENENGESDIDQDAIESATESEQSATTVAYDPPASIPNGNGTTPKHQDSRLLGEIKSLKDEVKTLQGQLRKKQTQVDEQISSYKELMRTSHERHLRAEADLKRMEKEVIEKEEARRRSEEREREAIHEQELLRKKLQSQQELQADQLQQLSLLEQTREELARLQIAHAHLNQLYEAAEKEVNLARDLHRSNQEHFQDREESLSTETLQFMRQLTVLQQEVSDKAAEARTLEVRCAAAVAQAARLQEDLERVTREKEAAEAEAPAPAPASEKKKKKKAEEPAEEAEEEKPKKKKRESEGGEEEKKKKKKKKRERAPRGPPPALLVMVRRY